MDKGHTDSLSTCLSDGEWGYAYLDRALLLSCIFMAFKVGRPTNGFFGRWHTIILFLTIIFLFSLITQNYRILVQHMGKACSRQKEVGMTGHLPGFEITGFLLRLFVCWGEEYGGKKGKE